MPKNLNGFHEPEAVSDTAFALTEPQSGSDVANWLGIADVYTLFARTGEAPGAKGLSAFILPNGLPGFEIVERRNNSAHPLATLRFTDCRIPKSALLGKPVTVSRSQCQFSMYSGPPLPQQHWVLRVGHWMTLNRKPDRLWAHSFSIYKYPGHIADMALDGDAAALLVYRAAWTKDSGAPRVTREAAMAKLFATDQAQQIIDKAVQLHGGDGVKSNEPVERLYREIRALRIYEGASDVQRVVIARQTMDASG